MKKFKLLTTMIVAVLSLFTGAAFAFQASSAETVPAESYQPAVATPIDNGDDVDGDDGIRVNVIQTCDMCLGGPDAVAGFCPGGSITANQMRDAIVPAAVLPPGCTLGPATFLGACSAGGKFGMGAGPIGIATGGILSTGNIRNVLGGGGANKNSSQSTSQSNGQPGDPMLNALIAPFTTFDRAELSFTLSCTTPQSIRFNFTFGSEEYNEWKNTRYQDVFALFIDGGNRALIPTPLCNAGNSCWYPPVRVGKVNLAKQNTNCFINNKIVPNPRQTQLDGLTTVLQTIPFITVPGFPGGHVIRIKIADGSDRVYDSDVFITAKFGPATPEALGNTGACCLPLNPCANDVTQSDCLAGGGSYQGDGTTCSATTGACIVTDPSGNPTCFQTPSGCCGGAFQGNGSNCPSIGACCQSNGSCVVTQQSTCTGAFNGNGTVCEGDVNGDGTDDACSCAALADEGLRGVCVPEGACMIPATVAVGCACVNGMTQQRCLDVGGTYEPGVFCSQDCPAVDQKGLALISILVLGCGAWVIRNRRGQLSTA